MASSSVGTLIDKSLGTNGVDAKKLYISALTTYPAAVNYFLTNLQTPPPPDTKKKNVPSFLDLNLKNISSIIARNNTINGSPLPKDTKEKAALSGAIGQILTSISIVNNNVINKDIVNNALPEYNAWIANQSISMFTNVSKFGAMGDSMNWYMIILVVLIVLAAYYYFNKKSTPKFTIPQQIAQFGRTIRAIRRI
uniref:Uncharacterized protein n=1 Tax=viral metagenome TaxID=1070528 RepID=A0A6C0AZJ9_9ZZZZ